ncbi:hypothetical protein QTP70_022736 [Hemibagrus guttatus]|uniref:Reverse transcriptase domain-containing protein n=1 Tax=Hemibagrus guttatus TaxID=175788 RepID=A0AAE0Q0M6_9TELE|nr:hypothetical protein QTP70_022736 [Hemibagrus guttatus]
MSETIEEHIQSSGEDTPSGSLEERCTRPTTRRKEHKGPVPCVLGSGHGRGPQRPKPWTKNLAFGTWNVTSLGGKEPELVREVERYRLEIVGLASTHSLGSGTQLLERGWTLFFSGVPHGERRWAGVGLLIAPQLSRHVLEFSPVNERVVSLRINIAWRSGTVPLDWATGVVVPLFKKGDRRVCSNYRGITLLSLPGKVYSRVLERRIRPLVEPRIQEEQCGFRPSRGTLDQLYTLHRVLEGSWEFAQPVHMCFVDLEKAFDRVPLWEVLWEYGVRGPLLRAVRSLYNRSRSLVRIASCLGLQHALGHFAAECEAAGMRVSTSKLEAMVLDQKKVACTLQVGGEVLPQVEEFKYLGVLFTSEGRMDREIDRRISAAAAVMRK